MFAAFWAATLASPPAIRRELAIMGVSSLLAFGVRLARDLTKKVSGTMRMFATLMAGLAFSATATPDGTFPTDPFAKDDSRRASTIVSPP